MKTKTGKWRPVTYISPKGVAFKKDVANLVWTKLGKPELITGRLTVTIGLAAPNMVQDGDIDNRIKPTLDAIKGVLFEDDRQVDRVIVDRLPVCKPGWADVTVCLK